MSGFGSTLKFAREQKGLSVAQVSEMTRLSPTMVELLEQDNFSMVPAALYGRGFVKLFCQAVGLDPKPMIEQFMQLYGNGDSSPRVTPSFTPPPARTVPPPTATEAPSADEPPVATQHLITPQHMPDEPVEAVQPIETPASRYAAPQPIDERPPLTAIIFHHLHRIPSQVWRFATLAFAAAILATVIFFGVRALYRATSDTSEAQTETAAETVQETAEETATKTETETVPETRAEAAAPAAPVDSAKPRRGTVIEPLYVD